MRALGLVSVLVAALALVWLSMGDAELDWDERPVLRGLDAPVEGLGAIEEIGADELARFYGEFWEKKPVIVRGARRHDNGDFRRRVSRQRLLADFGSVHLTLSTANTASYDKQHETLREYVARRMGPQNVSISAVETLYQFGDNAAELEQHLLPHYELPRPWMDRASRHALSFGLAGDGSGVPMHTHDAVFAEVLYGRKRWFLTPPDVRPDFNGSETMLYWFRHRLPSMDRSALIGGICKRGDLIYIPSYWYHSTLNIGQTVFISTFL